MPQLPQPECPTIQNAKAVAEFTQAEERRDYIGASLIGHPCARHIWYQYHGYAREPFDAETLWRFADGHHTEAVVIERLRQVVGVTVWDRDEQGNQLGYSAMGGKFKGHVDGIIKGLVQAPKTPHVLEVKCVGEKGYAEFKKLVLEYGEKKALERWNSTYYMQAQTYMHYMKLDRHYLVVALAGGRDMAACRTEYNPEHAEILVDRADRILQATTEPARVSDKPDFYICRWCPFAKVCHA
jgi:CRISPR/Cas system-associated exonuclease Cas4 (RecB family)